MKKHYCTDCKFYRDTVHYPCKVEKTANKVSEQYFTSKKEITFYDSLERNKNGNCADYKYNIEWIIHVFIIVFVSFIVLTAAILHAIAEYAK